jgi:tRNA(fMet)-specific endonuclease VapC
VPYLLDSDWAIRALAGHQTTVATLRRLAPEGIAVSLITVGELYEGALGAGGDSHLNTLRRFLRVFPALTLTDSIMVRFARIRADLRRRGALIPDFDLLVGATALQHDLILLTSNLRHMRRIPGLQIYT